MAVWKDIRYGLRQLRRNPAFTFTVLATLGLCIGANTAIYSVLDAVLLRPLPYPSPERLVLLVTQTGQETQELHNGALFQIMRDGVPGLDVAAYSDTIAGINFAAGGRVAVVRRQRISAGYFRVLGVEPRWGREFSREQDSPGGASLAVVSYGFWRRELGGDPAAVGKTILLRGEPHRIVGIMPRLFRTQAPVDVWTPLRPSRQGEGAGPNYRVVARLRPDASWAEVEGQLTALSHFLPQMPGFPRISSPMDVRMLSYQSALTGSMRRQLWVAWAAVLVVLAIGCANVAGLLLARSGVRRREIATRLALGGSRGRIVRQILAECLVLAVSGSVVGAAVGAFSIDWLRALGAQDLEKWYVIELDGRVLMAMLAIAVVTSVLFGLFPALHISSMDVRAVLMESGRGAPASRRRWPLHALVAGEVALSLVLLVAAGLLLRTLNYTGSLAPGFDPRNVVAAESSLEDQRYQTREAVDRLFAAGLERIRRLRGVASAAVALTLPYERPLNDSFREIDGDTGRHMMAEMVYLTPGYFETMRIPLLAGRDFEVRDGPQAPAVVVVSESFANRYFHGTAAALGRHLEIERAAREIVGVVGDVEQHSSLGEPGLPISLDPTIYLPVAQMSDLFLADVHHWLSPRWVIRALGPAGPLERQVRNVMASLDDGVPLAGFRTMAEVEARSTGGQRYLASLLAALALLALLLAAVGIYGTISLTITRRQHELGVRIALGSPVRQMLADVAAPGLVPAIWGIGIGLVLARFVVGFLGRLLFGVRPGDPLTFVATSLVLLLVAAGATVAAGVRLARMDAAATLRSD